MPRLVVDEESSGEDIPRDAARDGSGDEEEEDEDEYVIEEIVGHEYDAPSDEILYHVKWEGYEDEADMTWEPEENLLSAQDALNTYFKKIGGKPTPNAARRKAAGSKKRKAADTPKHAMAKAERGKSETPERSTKRTNGAGATEMAAKDDKWKLPKGSWEDQVESIDTIEEALDDKGMMKRFVYVLWENGSKTRHQLATVNEKCPQKMLRYYESHLVFRSAAADMNGEATSELRES